MPDQVEQILFDPTIGKLVSAIVGILVVIVIVRIAQRSMTRVVKENATRYKVRKFITFVGYLQYRRFSTVGRLGENHASGIIRKSRTTKTKKGKTP